AAGATARRALLRTAAVRARSSAAGLADRIRGGVGSAHAGAAGRSVLPPGADLRAPPRYKTHWIPHRPPAGPQPAHALRGGADDAQPAHHAVPALATGAAAPLRGFGNARQPDLRFRAGWRSPPRPSNAKVKKMDIAMIGLGRMGANMAQRLQRGGHRVVGFDPMDAARAQAADRKSGE